MTLDSGRVTLSYSYPLGGKRWLLCEYIEHADFFTGRTGKTRWRFTRGGEMKPEHWRDVLAEGLSGFRRFGGRSMTVAWHSVLLARYHEQADAPWQVQMLDLLHDASEALGVGDMNTNLKRLIGAQIRQYEDDLFQFLVDDLDLRSFVTPDHFFAVHAADKVFGQAEAKLGGFENGEPFAVDESHMLYQWLRRWSSGDGEDAGVYVQEWDRVLALKE